MDVTLTALLKAFKAVTAMQAHPQEELVQAHARLFFACIPYHISRVAARAPGCGWPAAGCTAKKRDRNAKQQ